MPASELMSPLYGLYIRKSDVIEMRSMIPCANAGSPIIIWWTFVTCRHYTFLASAQVFSSQGLQPTFLMNESVEIRCGEK